MREKNKTEHMNATRFYSDNMFGLLNDLRPMAEQVMRGSGRRLVNTRVQLEIERNAIGSGTVNYHIFVFSGSMFKIMGRQLDSAV